MKRGDVALTESFGALQDARKAGARIEWATPASRRRLFNQNRALPDDPTSFARSRNTANALFGLDDLGRPTVFLRRDTTRIEFLEELKHLDQFNAWSKLRPAGETAAQRSAAWLKHIADPKNVARLEIDAAEHVLDWLRRSSGTTQEIEAITRRLAHWQDVLLGLGGRL